MFEAQYDVSHDQAPAQGWTKCQEIAIPFMGKS